MYYQKCCNSIFKLMFNMCISDPQVPSMSKLFCLKSLFIKFYNFLLEWEGSGLPSLLSYGRRCSLPFLWISPVRWGFINTKILEKRPVKINSSDSELISFRGKIPQRQSQFPSSFTFLGQKKQAINDYDQYSICRTLHSNYLE